VETQARFTTQGLVIKEMNAGENDRLVTLLTREYGILKAYVPGAKSIKSKRSPATTLLTYSNFTVNRKNEVFRITEASAITSFFTAGTELEVLSLSQYFCELSYTFVQPMTPNEEFLRLILNSLHFLTKEKKYPPLIKAITEFRIAAISGYMPDLLACKVCGKFEDEIMYFNIENGSLCCGECIEQTTGYMAIDAAILSAMRHIALSEFGKLYAFELSKKSADRLSLLTERYLTFQSDNSFAALDFYNHCRHGKL
jgi:DNA repair protein RecO (recombination protein O)